MLKLLAHRFTWSPSWSLNSPLVSCFYSDVNLLTMFDSPDKFIQSKRREYADPSSRQNMNRLTSDLSDISDIMRSNITEVLDRGRALDGTLMCSLSLSLGLFVFPLVLLHHVTTIWATICLKLCYQHPISSSSSSKLRLVISIIPPPFFCVQTCLVLLLISSTNRKRSRCGVGNWTSWKCGRSTLPA